MIHRKIFLASTVLLLMIIASTGLSAFSNASALASEITGSLSPKGSSSATATFDTAEEATGPALTSRVAVNNPIIADGGVIETAPPAGEVLGTSTDTATNATSPSSWSWWMWALLALLVLGVISFIYAYNTRDENTQRLNSRR